MIVAYQWNRSTPVAPALHDVGGSILLQIHEFLLITSVHHIWKPIEYIMIKKGNKTRVQRTEVFKEEQDDQSTNAYGIMDTSTSKCRTLSNVKDENIFEVEL
jgi:hypothetical protein